MTGMNADGLGVTPELLSGAAAAIDAAVRGSEVGGPPTPAGGADYGHPGVTEAVALFGSAVGEATHALVAGAERASTGLRAGAGAYLAQEAAALRAVTREQARLGAGLGPQQTGLAELMGVAAARRTG